MLTSTLPPLGAPLMLEVDLPRLEIDLAGMALPEHELPKLRQDTFLLLTAEGRVLRHHCDEHGFAAVIKNTSFAHQEKGYLA